MASLNHVTRSCLCSAPFNDRVAVWPWHSVLCWRREERRTDVPTDGRTAWSRTEEADERKHPEIRGKEFVQRWKARSLIHTGIKQSIRIKGLSFIHPPYPPSSHCFSLLFHPSLHPTFSRFLLPSPPPLLCPSPFHPLLMYTPHLSISFLYMFSSIHLSNLSSVHTSVTHSSTHPSIRPSVCLPVCLFVPASVHPSIHPFSSLPPCLRSFIVLLAHFHSSGRGLIKYYKEFVGFPAGVLYGRRRLFAGH